MVPTLAQFGYVTGLLLFVPLGDVIRRRALLSALLIGTVAALVAAAAARAAAAGRPRRSQCARQP